MLIGDWIGNKTKCILGAAFFSVILILNPLAAFATGAGDTPTTGECDNPTVKNDLAGPTMSDSHDAGADNIITGICIKDGDMSFTPNVCGNSDKHSCLLTTTGSFNVGINDCYNVMGIGTQEVTVSENQSCQKDLSHVEYFIDFNGKVGGHGGITHNTALLLSGSHLTASWMIPLLVSAIGIGAFIVTRK